MDEGATQSQSGSPGARLAAARERAGMTLLQAAERLRLDVGTLQALEAGRFHTLGAAVFVRGHLRHYAELVGLPVGEIDAAYEACSAQLAPLPDLRRTTTLPGTPASRRVALPPRVALIGAIVLVLLALVWWAMRVPPGQRHAATPSSSSSSSAAASPAGAAVPPVRDTAEAGPEPPVAAAPAAAVAESRNSSATSRDGAQAAQKEAAAAGKEAAAGKARVRIAIRFNQDSWTEIYDAHGATLFHDVGVAGSERHLSGVAPLRLLIGNPDGIALELDGNPVTLRPAAEGGRPQRFHLDSAGRVSELPTTPSQRGRSASSARSAPAEPSAPFAPSEPAAPFAPSEPAAPAPPP
jgi:cytoskeleton protein RodZ